MRALFKPFRMLLELLVLAVGLLWDLLCLTNVACHRALAVLHEVTVSVKGGVRGLRPLLVLLTWTLPRLALNALLTVLCCGAVWGWRCVVATLPYCLLVVGGSLLLHVLWCLCDGHSLSAMLRMLNLTLLHT